jgi:hypothetical protein
VSEPPADPSLALAATVADILGQAGLEGVLIGAIALAVHNYPRSTTDVDFATDVNPFSHLRALGTALQAAGLAVDVRMPDADDPLGGVVHVHNERGGSVQVVNYYNPRSDRPSSLGRDSIRTAVPAGIEGLDVRVVDLPHLVALKLYAGGPKSTTDVIGLLEANPDADLDGVAEVCARHGLEVPLRRLLGALHNPA